MADSRKDEWIEKAIEYGEQELDELEIKLLRLVLEQEDIAPEFVKAVDEHFWELV